MDNDPEIDEPRPEFQSRMNKPADSSSLQQMTKSVENKPLTDDE